MTSAIIYIRVSTDEQAQKGYSQRSQEEKLNNYCKDNHIEIVQTVFEDHSAKNFERPAWAAMLKHLNMNKSTRPQLILFTRWDRFSRNTANAYYMITQLKKLGIEPQATDQPLDMAVPENKVLLAMNIVTAEVENDRRSLNIKQSIHKAKKEGRYMGRAPIGYLNISLPDGIKTIIPREPEATLIKKVFEGFDKNVSVRSYYKTVLKTGLKCSLNAFFNILQNPVYCGKIRVPSLDGKNIVEVQGIHNPLISIELLLVKGTIEEEDYHSIKSDCENRIDILGAQLNDAYKLDVQEDRSFKKLASSFLKPACLFQDTDNSIILKVASLFLNENLIYNDNNITNYLKDEIKYSMDSNI